MLRTFFFIPTEIAGRPLFGFGLLLAAWAVFSVAWMVYWARRQGWNADTWGYVPFLLLVGAVIAWVLPAVCEPDHGLPIRGYGTMMLLAVVAGTLLTVSRAKRVGLDPDVIFSLAFWMLLPGIVGARAFYVIEYWQSQYWPAYTEPGGGLGPLLGAIVNVSKGGLVVYGSFFGGVAGLIAFAMKYRLSALALADLIAPGMFLGLAIGRVGCLLNGCCFGAVCDGPLSITFPPDSPPYSNQVIRGQMVGFTLSGNPNAEPRILHVRPGSAADRAGLKPSELLRGINGFRTFTCEQAYWALDEAFREKRPLQIEIEGRALIEIPAVDPPKRSLPVHPTQIYSQIDALAICLLLLFFDRFRRRDGALLALALSIYPVSRFFIEMLRTDEAAVFGTGLSIAQNVSSALLVFAAGLWCYILWRPPVLHFSPRGKGG